MNTTPTAGYSGTPLAKKLGIKEGSCVLLVGAPDGFEDFLDPPERVNFDGKLTDRTDIVHVFATSREQLAKHLAHFRKQIRPDAMLWVSWPKKASKVPTDITEGVIP